MSRLVVDVERFEDDRLEPMATVGMGAVYVKTSSGGNLRRPITATERDVLLSHWYRPHHQRLYALVAATLQKQGQALIIDAHSYSSVRLPYEADTYLARPEICLGIDAFHTPLSVKRAFVSAFEQGGFEVGVNTPFAGTMVPAGFFRTHPEVLSIMIEVRRDLYMNEATGQKSTGFDKVAQRIRECVKHAVDETVQAKLNGQA